MDLEVVGRHALFFDDDANAAFVNSEEALVEWNSLLIDRYDVRHLLSSPPPPRNRRRQPASPPDASLEPELDRERFLDLPSDEQEQDVDKHVEPVISGGYRSVGFSYGNQDEATEQKNSDVESVYQPPFPVPENLIRNLPPTEKIHQIMARTATFVSKHGGQSEIVLRVKQGNNPTFGFLMPDHHLHPYFRFLVDHQELLNSEVTLEQEKKGDNRPDRTGGALSLLGSVYGSGEDEDGPTEDSPKPEKSNSIDTTAKDKKEKMRAIKGNPSINTVKIPTGPVARTESNTLDLVGAETNAPKVERPIVEPPAELRRVVEKIVEFILRNGKEFETVLAEQDRKFGRFPFLLPSNQYHPYYLQALQKTREPKSATEGSVSRERKTSRSDGDTPSSPNDYDKKEKFKMVLGKPKKDEPEPAPKPTRPNPEVVVDAEAAAAILKAATSGVKNPGLELFPKLSRGSNSSECSVQKKLPISVPIAKAMAETTALTAANEADSSEASFTREQKLKAERLRRAKMFAAMIKSGAGPLKPEPVRSVSVEPVGSAVSSQIDSSVPIDVEKIDKSEDKSRPDETADRKSKQSYRSRPEKDGEDGTGDRKRKHRRHSSSKRNREESEYSDRHRRHRHRDRISDDDEEKERRSRRHRHKPEREAESERGDSETNQSVEVSREGSGDLVKQGEPSTVVSEDLRAKIRAMLMATM